MFKAAVDKTYNLLASGYAYPREMIKNFAKADDEATRQMFRGLYDESRDLAERVEAFKKAAEEIRVKYDDGTWRNHYQNTNAISTYLWLRYPDRYYIYKYEVFRDVAGELSSDYMPKRNGSVETMIGGYAMYDEICEAVSQDEDIRNLLDNALTASYYSDPVMKTVTMDIGFYICRFYLAETKAAKEEAEWFPKDYTPGISAAQWAELLRDSSVFTQNALQLMKHIKDYGGQATCTQLAVKYGETKNFYNSGSVALARRVAEKTNCELYSGDDERDCYWTVLYTGKNAVKEDEGAFIWKLRPELSEALDNFDMADIPLYAEQAEADSSAEAQGYWWLTANPTIWSFSDIRVGEKQSYTLYSSNGNKRRVFQNFLDAKVGDTVICYESVPVKKVVALGRITQANDGKAIFLKRQRG